MSATIENQAKLVVPAEPKPLYPDVPWWSVLVTAMVFSVVSVIVTVVVFKSGFTGPNLSFQMPGLGGLLVDTVLYMPHIILLFGVLGDMFTYDGVWSIPSLIGVLSIFINFVFKYFWIGLDDVIAQIQKAYNGPSAPPAAAAAAAAAVSSPPKLQGGAKFGETYDGCYVQGFKDLNSPYSPQTLVITATVFSYYCFDIVQNRGWVNSVAALTFFILTYLGQMGILATMNEKAGCEGGGAIAQGVRSMLEGVAIGGTSYGIVKTYYPTRLPSSTVSPFPRRTASDLTPGPDGTMRDADGFPYVVLPNGQAVPDLSSAQSRQAFGNTASKNLGSGTPATACNIAANSPASDRLAQISALAAGP